PLRTTWWPTGPCWACGVPARETPGRPARAVLRRRAGCCWGCPASGGPRPFPRPRTPAPHTDALLRAAPVRSVAALFVGTGSSGDDVEHVVAGLTAEVVHRRAGIGAHLRLRGRWRFRRCRRGWLGSGDGTFHRRSLLSGAGYAGRLRTGLSRGLSRGSYEGL